MDQDEVDEFAEKVERARLRAELYAKQEAQKEDAPISDADLKEMEERAAEATKGPWITEINDGYITGNIISKHHTYAGSPDKQSNSVTGKLTMTVMDAHFIAYSRTDIPRLIAEVKKLRAQLG